MFGRFAPTALALAIATTFIAPVAATPFKPGEVELALLRGTEGAAGFEVRMDGRVVGTTDSAGRLRFVAGDGLHTLVISNSTGRLAFAELRLGSGEAAELAITLPEGRQAAGVETQTFVVDDGVRHGLIGTVRERGAGGAAIAGATVRAKGRVISTRTDEQGNFRLELPRGSYDIEVTAPGAETRVFSGVSASPLLAVAAVLEVPRAAGAAVTDSAAGTQLDKVVVRAPLQRRTAVAVERLASAVVDTVTQEEITAAGDSDAGEAFKRVTGVTVQEDVLVVRGLSDRYSSTFLNGAEIPSPNPSRRVVPLDIFPTELLGGLTVQKTYTANLPADFSGGAALLETRPIPSVNKGSLKAKLGGNSRSTFLNTLTYVGSSGDDYGHDEGLRAIPATIERVTEQNRVRLQSLPDNVRRAAVNTLPNVWEPRVRENTPPDAGASLSYGGRIKPAEGGMEFGYLLSGLYDHTTRFRREQRNDLRPGSTTVSILDAADQERTIEAVDTGFIGSFNAKLARNHQIDLISMVSRNTEKGTFFTQALFNENFLRQDQRTLLDHVETQLNYNQLLGRHKLPQYGDLSIRWQLAYSLADRDVRDRRSYAYSRSVETGDGLYRLAINSGDGDLPQREWEYLSDENLDGGLEFELPAIAKTDTFSLNLKAGARATRKERDLFTVRYSYFNPGAQQSPQFQAARLLPSPELILTETYFGTGGFDIRNANTQGVGGGNSEAYTGEQTVDAGFVSTEFDFGGRYKVDVGARVEKSTIDVITGDPRQGPTNASTLSNTDVLPALNATWYINKQQQLRAAYSQTLNRPQFRELADVQFLDPETRFTSFGNPSLVQSEINNFDLRFEQYWSASRAVSVALFYKDFKNPIEATIESDANGRPIRSFTNSPSAIDYGIEVDGRYGLDALASVHPALGRLFVAGNFSLIESEVDLPGGSRKLQGQSPYIVNFTLGYAQPGRTEVTLLLNTFGPRLSEIGFDGLPDAEEQSYPLLDFNLRQKIGQSWRTSFKLRNLLDPTIEVKQANVTQRSYKLGSSAQFTLEYEF